MNPVKKKHVYLLADRADPRYRDAIANRAPWIVACYVYDVKLTRTFLGGDGFFGLSHFPALIEPLQTVL